MTLEEKLRIRFFIRIHYGYTKLTGFLARIFGKKYESYEDGYHVVAYKFRGIYYIIKCEEITHSFG